MSIPLFNLFILSKLSRCLHVWVSGVFFGVDALFSLYKNYRTYWRLYRYVIQSYKVFFQDIPELLCKS
jgi:hypothetical protein